MSLIKIDPVQAAERAKVATIAATDAQKDAALAAGFAYGGFVYHCDAVFQGQVTSYVVGFESGIIPAGASVPIRRKDNTNTVMAYTEMKLFAGALMQHVQGIYAASWTAKDALL